MSHEPISIEVQGKVLGCVVCGHDEFQKREAQLNTATASFWNVEWMNPSATCYVCDRCGYVHWFLPR